MRNLSIILASALLAACATGYNPEYRYDQIRILNNSDQMLKKLTIRDQNSQRTLDCGDVNGFGFCQHPLPKPRYQGLPLEVSWVTSDGRENSQPVVPASRGPYLPGRTIQVELYIAEDGSLGGVLKQESSSIR